jgi:hypothetical protein
VDQGQDRKLQEEISLGVQTKMPTGGVSELLGQVGQGGRLQVVNIINNSDGRVIIWNIKKLLFLIN